MAPRRLRHLIALVLVLAGLATVLAGFFGWLVVGTDGGGSSVIDGWGGISGDNAAAGDNLNTFTGGEGSFRPGLANLSMGLLLMIAALVVLPAPRGEHPYRIGAALTALVAVVVTGWGIWRLASPDSLAIFEDGDAGAGAGPWITVVCGLVAVAAVVPVFAGRVDVDSDRPTRPPHRGIQPR